MVEPKANLSDEFIYEATLKTLRFSITLPLLTLGAIFTAIKIMPTPVHMNIMFFLAIFLLLVSNAISILGQFMATIKILKKEAINLNEFRGFFILFWSCYVPSLFFVVVSFKI